MSNRPPEKRLEEKVGRFLGRLVKKAQQTKVWRETAEAFEQGKRGEGPSATPRKNRAG